MGKASSTPRCTPPKSPSSDRYWVRWRGYTADGWPIASAAAASPCGVLGGMILASGLLVGISTYADTTPAPATRMIGYVARLHGAVHSVRDGQRVGVQIDPVSLRGTQPFAGCQRSQRRQWSRAMSGSLIGICSAVGALGGVGINLALRESYLQQWHRDLGVLAIPGFLRRCRTAHLGHVCAPPGISLAAPEPESDPSSHRV